MLAAIDLDLMQCVSMAIGVQRQTEMNPITIVFAGINDDLHSRDFLSRLNARDNGYIKKRNFVYAMVALLSEGKYDVIISAPNCKVEAKNLRPPRAELPAVWWDISKAMRGFKDHSLNMLVLDEVLGFELSNCNRQLKLKPGIIDDHHRVAMSNDLWFRRMEIKEEGEKRQNSKETKTHLAALDSSVSSIGSGRFRARHGDD